MIANKQVVRAVIYARFSPRRDPASCESIETQVEACRAACGKLGWSVIGVESDDSMSGDDVDRPGLWRAVELCRRGVVLVVLKADRLARAIYLDETIRRQVAKQKGRIHVVEGSPNGDEPESVMIRQILAAFAEYERKVIGARTKASMLRHQASGRAMSARLPFGFREGEPTTWTDSAGRVKHRRMMVPDPVEQAVIARIMQLFASGLTPTKIATQLRRDGIKGRSKWRHRNVWAIVERTVKHPCPATATLTPAARDTIWPAEPTP